MKSLALRRRVQRIFGAPPARILPFQAHNRRFNWGRKPIRLAVRAPTAIRVGWWRPRDSASERTTFLRSTGRHLALAHNFASDLTAQLFEDELTVPCRHKGKTRVDAH